MNNCMIIRGVTKDLDGKEQKFRPATPSPDKHWVYMLLDQYNDLYNMSIRWDEGEPMVAIARASHKEDESAFKHVMGFAKMHGLDVTCCQTECKKCEGHDDCLTEHK